MNRRAFSLGLALLGAALAGPVWCGETPPPAADLVPFKATMTGSLQDFVIPLDPPVVSTNLAATGQADFLGPCTSANHMFVRLGADGVRPAAITDGIGVLMAANGDALFITFSGLPRPPAADEWSLGELAFTITGGRGRFAGAFGSGVVQDVVTGLPPHLQITRTFEGMISRPKQ